MIQIRLLRPSTLFLALATITLAGLPSISTAQLAIPGEPADPSTLDPVPLKRERSVAVGKTSVRILVVGDAGIRDGGWLGSSDSSRKAVAARAREVCSEEPCDLVLMLGDNLYSKGIRIDNRVEDEEALAGIIHSFLADDETPVYMVLGNHDWSSWFIKHSTADRELEWIGSETELDVRGNAHFYEFEAGPVAIWALDTTPLVRKSSATKDPNLASWLGGIATSEAPWRVVAAHHPMRSNAGHGNPGTFRDGPFPFRIWPGKGFRELLDQRIEGVADLYLAGHEHNLQFISEVAIETPSGTAAAVVGSASKCTGPGRRFDNPGMELEAYNYGFVIVEATLDRLEISFHLSAQEGWRAWSAWRTQKSGWQFSTQDPPGTDRACKQDDSCCPAPQ